MKSQVTDTLPQNEPDGGGEVKLQAYISEEAHTLIRIEAAKRRCSNAVVIESLAKKYLRHNTAPAAEAPDAA